MMKRAIWVVATVFLLSCNEVPPEQPTLPAPLQGEMVEEGHLCDPSALAKALAHKYPGIDPATAQQEIDHLLYVFGCGSPAAAAPPSFATSAPGLQTCAGLQAVTEERQRYGIPAPPEDEEMLRRCRESQSETAAPLSATPSAPDLGEEIPLHREGNTFSVPVLVNGIIPIAFVLDTGAGDVLLPADVVFTFVANRHTAIERLY